MTECILTEQGGYYYDEDDVDLDTEDIRLRDGSRFTNERAAEIAEEALAEVRRRGRPSLSSTGETSPTLSVRIPSQLKIRVEQRAVAEGRPISEVTRDALERYLAED